MATKEQLQAELEEAKRVAALTRKELLEALGVTESLGSNVALAVLLNRRLGEALEQVRIATEAQNEIADLRNRIDELEAVLRLIGNEARQVLRKQQ